MIARVGRVRFKTITIIPLQTLLIVIFTVPWIITIYVSFTSWSLLSPESWYTAPFVGVKNYAHAITDERFLSSILLTLYIVGISVSLEFLIGFGLAFLFLGDLPGKKIFNSLMLIPMMVMPAVNGYMFRLIYQVLGPLNKILSIILRSNVEISWLHQASTATFCIISAEVWQWVPFVFLIMLSGLLALPQEPKEAANIDGASTWQIFRYISLPMLKPLITIVLVLRSIEVFKIFDIVYIMTFGGPGYSTQTVSVYLFEEAMRFGRLGYVSAECQIISIVMLIVLWFTLKPVLRRIV